MENEGTPPAATPETPATLDVAEAPWAEVRAAARAGRLDAAAPESGGATATGDAGEANPDDDAAARATADEGRADRDAEPDGAASEPATKGKPEADPERLAASLRGNIKQLQDLRDQDRQQFQALQEQNQHLQQQFAQLQRERQEAQYLQQIQQQVAGLPEEYRQPALQAALDERRKQQGLVERQQQLEGYAGYLGQQAQAVEAQRLAVTVQQLPHMMEDFASYVAQETEAPVESLQELIRSDEFRNVYALARTPQDVTLATQIAGEILGAVAKREVARERGRKEANRQQAVEGGAYRQELGGGTGGERTLIQKIETMSSDDFRAYRERVRKSRSLQRG